MRILLADDQPILPSALRAWVEQLPNSRLVGVVIELISLPAKVATLQPDILLLDWELEGMENKEARRNLLQQLHRQAPRLQVIALSGQPDGRREALDAGADAFISKTESPEQLRLLLTKLLPKNN
ncbi:MAG: response regulator transcription factor [Caldilineaceae bacterium]